MPKSCDNSVTAGQLVGESGGGNRQGTVTGIDVHGDVEEFEASGELLSSSCYDTSRMQQQNVSFDPGSGSGACDQAMQDKVKAAFKKALDDGRKWMWNYGQGAWTYCQ